MVGPSLKTVLATTTLAAIGVAFVFSVAYIGGQGASSAPTSLTSTSAGSAASSAKEAGNGSTNSTVATTTVSSSTGSTSSFLLNGSKGAPQGQSGSMLTLSFDKASYAAGGGGASVTVVLLNTGTQSVTVDDPGIPPQLVFYDSSMKQVGTWTKFLKPQPMNPPAGPLVLDAGQKFSWTVQWGLVLTTGSGSQVAIAPGQYLVKAALQVGVGGSYGQMTSNAVQITIS